MEQFFKVVRDFKPVWVHFGSHVNVLVIELELLLLSGVFANFFLSFISKSLSVPLFYLFLLRHDFWAGSTPLILPSVFLPANPFKLTIWNSNIQSFLRQLQHWGFWKIFQKSNVIFLFNSKSKSGFHGAKEKFLGSTVKFVIKPGCYPKNKWIKIFPENFYFCIFQTNLVIYLRVSVYKRLFGFSFWQILIKMSIRFCQYCV